MALPAAKVLSWFLAWAAAMPASPALVSCTAYFIHGPFGSRARPSICSRLPASTSWAALSSETFQFSSSLGVRSLAPFSSSISPLRAQKASAAGLTMWRMTSLTPSRTRPGAGIGGIGEAIGGAGFGAGGMAGSEPGGV